MHTGGLKMPPGATIASMGPQGICSIFYGQQILRLAEIVPDKEKKLGFQRFWACWAFKDRFLSVIIHSKKKYLKK